MIDAEGAYGLLGRTLGHSYSPRIHALLGAEYDYRLFEVEPEDVAAFMRESGFRGVNVTIPYKVDAMNLCDELSDAARKIGCVNVVLRRDDGTLYGDNTDYYGFSYLLDSAGLDVAGCKVLMLGNGGAAKTVRTVLSDRGAREVVTAGRTGAVTYDNLSEHYDADFIVNTTPVGMYPRCPDSVIDLEPFAREGATREGYADGLSGLADVVYNPARTGLMLQAERLGVPCAGGLSMLVAQAKASVELFCGSVIADEELARVTRQMLFETSNIALIGMPGAGKSTVGAHMARLLSRPFADIDEAIPREAGKPIAAIFAEEGEDAFRAIEAHVTGEACKKGGQVIACGGGVVTRPSSYALLHQNSVIVLLKRPLSELEEGDRPMSVAKGIGRLWDERRRAYFNWADIVVDGNGLASEEIARRAVQALCEHMGVEGGR